MISRATLFWLLLTALVGYGLFHVKYEVMALEEELIRLNAATLREQNQIHVLEAEWSYLNQPSRLEEFNERHLHLKPIAPEQYGTIAALPPRRDPAADGGAVAANMIARIVPPRRPQPLAATAAQDALLPASAVR
jgi:hypothetical protein